MKKLIVSFDCGCSYDVFMESEDINILLERTKKQTDPMKDISWCRWVIEDDNKPNSSVMCPIHKGISATLNHLRGV